MTIYDLYVKHTNLSKIPNTRMACEIGLHICDAIFQHLSRTLLNSGSAGRINIANHNTIIQWYFGMLGRSIRDSSYIDRTFVVRGLLIELKIDEGPCLHSEFTLETLATMNPRVLVAFTAQLLYQLWVCMRLSIPQTSIRQFEICGAKLKDVIRDLTLLVGEKPGRNDFDFTQSDVPGIGSLRIRVEVTDGVNEFIILN